MNIVITGAGRGLGLEMVRRHIMAGDNVYALAHSLTDELKACECDNLRIIICELTDYENVIKIAGEIGNINEDAIENVNVDENAGEIGKEPAGNDFHVDILYNIAGLYYEDQRVGVEETDISKALKMYEVNAIAPLNVMKAFSPYMREGSVNLIVSSEAGSIGECGRSEEYGYCMSKAAVNMAAKIFSNETAGKNIATILYHPGWMRTQMGGARAAASKYSISAAESADRLMEIVDEALKKMNSGSNSESDSERNSESNSGNSPEIPFIDYTGKKWSW